MHTPCEGCRNQVICKLTEAVNGLETHMENFYSELDAEALLELKCKLYSPYSINREESTEFSHDVVFVPYNNQALARSGKSE